MCCILLALLLLGIPSPPPERPPGVEHDPALAWPRTPRAERGRRFRERRRLLSPRVPRGRRPTVERVRGGGDHAQAYRAREQPEHGGIGTPRHASFPS